MRYDKRIITTLLSLVFLVACGLQPGEEAETGIRASGFIESQVYTLASSIGGRVVAVAVTQGNHVPAGQRLITMDSTALERVRDQAQAGVSAAQAALDGIRNKPRRADIAAAEAAYAAALAEIDSAEATLDLLELSYAPFQPPDPDLHAAQSAIDVAQASARVEKAKLDQVEAGPMPGEIAVAEAALREAEAALVSVEEQLQQMTIESPIDGRVGSILVKRGEVVAPGEALIHVIDPDQLTLTVYLPATEVAHIQSGDPVIIQVDAYPETAFQGKVRRIADQAQFTPTDVQTQKERVKLVFQVEISVEDPGEKLSPGMPADAQFLP
jgi:HlyD family secretion protein